VIVSWNRLSRSQSGAGESGVSRWQKQTRGTKTSNIDNPIGVPNLIRDLRELI
jgi:hypothetical protein